MTNLAEAYCSEAAFLESAVVAALDGPTVTVVAAGRQLDARRAASCLLSPQVGDRVLVAHLDHEPFVLAVLERDEQTAAEVELPGDLRVRLPNGRAQLAAEAGIELATRGQTTLTSRALRLSALEGSVFVERLRMVGQQLDAKISATRLVAETIDTVAERLRQRLDHCHRIVARLEQLRAGTIDYKAKGYARLHAEDSSVTADKLVKVDGEQIHIG